MGSGARGANGLLAQGLEMSILQVQRAEEGVLRGRMPGTVCGQVLGGAVYGSVLRVLRVYGLFDCEIQTGYL